MRDIDPREAHRLWEAGEATILDVREEDEYEVTRIPGTPLIPMSEFTERVGDVPPEGALIVICRSGQRSARVCRWLAVNSDIEDVANLAGGIIAWAADDLPYEGDPPS